MTTKTKTRRDDCIVANFNLNKVILGGRLTADPELKQTQSGVSVCSFTIAVNRKFQKDGQQETDFINCQAWRQTAEFISRFFNKGSSICVVGAIQTRSWEDQSGQKRYATEVVVDEAGFVDGKNDSPTRDTTITASAPNPAQWDGKGTTYMPPAYGGQQAQFEEIPNDDNLPF